MFGLTVADWKDIAALTGAVLALGAFIRGLVEYARQGTQKRAEYFIAMRRRLKDTPSYNQLCNLNEQDDAALREVPFIEKLNFVGFFEEVALMMNSGQIRKGVTHYWFGYYALRCWESENFWHGLNREASYWFVFREFVRKMEREEGKMRRPDWMRPRYRF
jgi:hypothetical protein